MLARIRKATENKEQGFTLIELLVVMIIIGILAAIAVPTFMNQRKNGYRTAVKSDLRNAVTAIESWSVDNASGGGTYTGLTDAKLTGTTATDVNFVGTLPAVTLVVAAIPAVTADTYCLNGTHASLPGETFSVRRSPTGGYSEPKPQACA